MVETSLYSVQLLKLDTGAYVIIIIVMPKYWTFLLNFSKENSLVFALIFVYLFLL